MHFREGCLVVCMTCGCSTRPRKCRLYGDDTRRWRYDGAVITRKEAVLAWNRRHGNKEPEQNGLWALLKERLKRK